MPPKLQLALIVAAAENGIIGVEGDLPWRISADLKKFKQLTMGHSIIMGRKTHESIGRLLPGRTSVIVTRNLEYQVHGAQVVHSIEAAIEACQLDECPFVVGGAEIYRASLPYVTQIFLTRVHTVVEGDTSLPEIDWDNWESVDRKRCNRDDKNEFDYSFEHYRRLRKTEV